MREGRKEGKRREFNLWQSRLGRFTMAIGERAQDQDKDIWNGKGSLNLPAGLASSQSALTLLVSSILNRAAALDMAFSFET